MTSSRLATLGAVILVAGCALLEPSVEPKPTPDITSPVDGVIVAVDSAALGDVRGFTLRPANSPFSFGFVLGTLENPTEFPPSHLAEHQVSSAPVRVSFNVGRGGFGLEAYRLEDATPSGS